MKVLVVFYSMYGHIDRLAEAIAGGAREVVGTQVKIRRVPDSSPVSFTNPIEEIIAYQ